MVSMVELSRVELAKLSIFPMSFPLTAGPEAIATSIALGTTTMNGINGFPH